MQFVNYNYLGVTTQEMNVTHTANDYFTLPNCTATKDNYYVREGRFFETWDADAVGAVLRPAYETGTMISIRFATGGLYQTARNYLIDEGRIVDYCNGLTTLTYVEDTEQNVLSFRF
jgi:hypothetical protein